VPVEEVRHVVGHRQQRRREAEREAAAAGEAGVDRSRRGRGIRRVGVVRVVVLDLRGGEVQATRRRREVIARFALRAVGRRLGSLGEGLLEEVLRREGDDHGAGLRGVDQRERWARVGGHDLQVVEVEIEMEEVFGSA
jgi:hypothetical protein